MRGQDGQTGSMFSYVDIEERVPASHPLRKIREFVNAALAALDAEFARIYAADGRPSIAPERLLRAAFDSNPFFDPLGTPAYGTDVVQSVVPLVRGACDLLPDVPLFISRVHSGYAPSWGGLQTRQV